MFFQRDAGLPETVCFERVHIYCSALAVMMTLCFGSTRKGTNRGVLDWIEISEVGHAWRRPVFPRGPPLIVKKEEGGPLTLYGEGVGELIHSPR